MTSMRMQICSSLEDVRDPDIYLDYTLNEFAADLARPTWWIENSSSYHCYRTIRYPSGKSTPGFTLDRSYETILFGNKSGGIGSDATLIHTDFTCGIVHAFKDRRWMHVFPYYAGQRPGYYEIKYLQSEPIVDIPTDSQICLPISSLSHFLAEELPRVILGCSSGFAQLIYSIGLTGWQAMLVDQIASSFSGRHIRSDSLDLTQKDRYIYRLTGRRYLYVNQPTFYDGLSIVADFLHLICERNGGARLKSYSKIYEPKRHDLSLHANSKRIYISRLYHESLSKTTRPPRANNFNELAAEAHAHGWFVLCPERYTFWSIYMAVAEADHIVIDNGTSQLHALINRAFLRRLHDGKAFLSLLVSPDYISKCDKDEAWMWHINCLAAANFNLVVGSIVPETKHLEPYMQSCYFSPDIFRIS